MKKIFTLLTAIVLSATIAQAQYYYLNFPNAHENPGGLNKDVEQPGQAGWTTIRTSSATPAWSSVVSLPFLFYVNGNPMTDYKVSTSGVLTFSTSAAAVPSTTNAVLPDASIPDNSICVWGLAGTGANDVINQKTFGVAPNRQHWIQFTSYSAPGMPTSNAWTYWGIVLEESSNNIYLVDQRTFSSVALSLTLGVQIDNSTAYQVTGAPNTPSTVTNGGNADTDADNAYYMFVQGTQPANDAVLAKLTVPAIVGAPSSTNVTGEIMNYGSAAITSITIKYDMGGNVVADTKNGLNIVTGGRYVFSHATPFAITNPGTYDIKAWVELTGDTVNSNDTVSTTVDALSFVPTKRIVFEEGTGTWCQWCPRGAVFMDSLHKIYPDKALLIAVHNADPMTVATYDAGIGAMISGYPSGLVDRKGGEFDPSEFIDQYDLRINDFALCDVTPTVTFDGVKLDIDVSAHFAVALNGDYRFNTVIVEDDVTGTATGYRQSNAYAGGGNGIMGGYENKPNPVPAAQMVYDHVARAILGGFDGAAGSLPTNILADTVLHHTFQYTVPAAFDITQMHVISWVSDATTGEILNANRGNITLGVSNAKNNVYAMTTFPNPSNGNTKFSLSLDKSASLSYEVYDMFGKLIYAEDKGLTTPGKTEFMWNADQSLANGIYNVVVKIGTDRTSQKVVLNR